MDATNKKTLLFLLLILTAACFFRLWQLDSIPPSLWPDEAINANTAFEIKDTGSFKVFYPDNHGREGLFFLLISFAFSIFGISIWSFKLTSAVAGIITVFGQYLFSLEFFRLAKWKEKSAKITALVSSFFLAISFWHINFSRIGFRAILAPLVLVFSFYFFFRGLRTKKIWNFLFSGLFFGIGFHTYISFRLAVFLLGFALFFWFFISIKENWKKKYFLSVSLLLVATFIVALPIGIYFLENPEHFVSRALGVSIFDQESPVKEFFKSLAKHLAMFNFSGDLNWRHNFSAMPQLFFSAGILFIVGIIHSLARLLRGKSKNRGCYAFLFVWLFALLLPSALTTEGIPHALRTICLIPVAYLFAGLGAYLIYKWLASLWERKKWNIFILRLAIIIFFIASVFSTFVFYFIAWANHPALEEAFTKRFADVGYELNALPEETRKFVIKSEGDLPIEIPKFIQRTQNRQEAIYLNPEQIAETGFSPGDFIFTMNKEVYFLDSIRERFPTGILYEKELIWIYEIQ